MLHFLCRRYCGFHSPPYFICFSIFYDNKHKEIKLVFYLHPEIKQQTLNRT